MSARKLVQYISDNPKVAVGDIFIIDKLSKNPQRRNVISVEDKVTVNKKECRYITIDLYQQPPKLKMRSRKGRK